MKYTWQQTSWPNFNYDESVLDDLAAELALDLGEINGMIDALSTEMQHETVLQIMITEAIKTSAIEGEYYSRQDVMSSIKKNLGIHYNLSAIKNKNAKSIAKLVVEVRQSKTKQITETIIRKWHAILMEFSKDINAGKYRNSIELMQIISGSVGKETIHFEAPPAAVIDQEMKQFFCWYKDFKVTPIEIKKALVKTAIAHLYFETIHPFEDGNGRIGRAIAEKCFSNCTKRPIFMSISSTIEQNRKKYYSAIKKAQSSLEITDWLLYFSEIIFQAHKNTKQIIKFTLKKVVFLDQHKTNINARQKKVLLKIFEFGISGFEGGMTSKKYVSITKTSRATATRDLQDLLEKNIVIQKGEGRNIAYEINI